MKFMRCTALTTEGEFTVGRIYAVKDEMETDAKTDDRFMIVDDNDERLKMKYSDRCFERVMTVYGVWVCEDGNFDAGEVLSITGVDGQFLEVAGYGYFGGDCIELLDATNLRPGIVVCDEENGQWRKVSRVDEDFNVSIDGNPEEFRSVAGFSLAVVDGAVVDFPVLYCIDANGKPGELTVGESYLPVAREGAIVTLKNDAGEEKGYGMDRFSKKRKK